jgi:hypothetical protein
MISEMSYFHSIYTQPKHTLHSTIHTRAATLSPSLLPCARRPLDKIFSKINVKAQSVKKYVSDILVGEIISKIYHTRNSAAMSVSIEGAFRLIAKERGAGDQVNKENLIPFSVVKYAVDLQLPRSTGLSIEVIWYIFGNCVAFKSFSLSDQEESKILRRKLFLDCIDQRKRLISETVICFLDDNSALR